MQLPLPAYADLGLLAEAYVSMAVSFWGTTTETKPCG